MESDPERHLAQVERVLLCIGDAKQRARKAREELAAAGAEERLVAALAVTEQALDAERRRLMQSTYYSVPDEQDQLAV